MSRIDFHAASTELARKLIGASVFVDGVGGRIVETEAYDETDPASHSFAGKTARNAVMFGAPGRVYVYRSYGIHWCLNFSCMPSGHGAGVLIRALEPTRGLERMRSRRGLHDERLLCSGPGRLCQALGVTHAMNGLRLDRTPFRIVPRDATDASVAVAAGTRIGISKSRELPWRFVLAGSRFLSKPMRLP
ncbi:MAG: DNA-3-methyladenine glycosylase [Pseudomonadota bacterium]|nr:DNA-3-methyladenine glycosylase [Pseudomonadota bacterium]